MAKNSQTPVTTRLAAKQLRKAVDYAKRSNDLSPEQQERRQRGLKGFRDFIYQTSDLKRTKTEGVLSRWRDGREIDKFISAALVLWYHRPGASYRVTVNFDHAYKLKSFDDIRDRMTRLLREHGIKDFCFSFEVSKSGRLHCHGIANILDEGGVDALSLSLQQRFGKSDEIRHSLRGGNKIVAIDRVVYAPHDGQGPEYWAAYSIGDAMHTQAQLGWTKVSWWSQGLTEDTRRIYDWLRNPSIDTFPFNPEDTPDVERQKWRFHTDGQ